MTPIKVRPLWSNLNRTAKFQTSRMWVPTKNRSFVMTPAWQVSRKGPWTLWQFRIVHPWTLDSASSPPLLRRPPFQAKVAGSSRSSKMLVCHVMYVCVCFCVPVHVKLAFCVCVQLLVPLVWTRVLVIQSSNHQHQLHCTLIIIIFHHLTTSVIAWTQLQCIYVDILKCYNVFVSDWVVFVCWKCENYNWLRLTIWAVKS